MRSLLVKNNKIKESQNSQESKPKKLSAQLNNHKKNLEDRNNKKIGKWQNSQIDIKNNYSNYEN